MTPREAGELFALIKEPDWTALFDERKRSDFAFEEILTAWRKWHASPIGDKMRPADALEAMIALANLGIMPPRNTTERLPGLFEAQHDEHCWLVTEGRSWRVLGIEDKMLFLDSFGEERQIALEPASRWVKYCEGHAAVLEAQRK